jgi:hypothetical protein
MIGMAIFKLRSHKKDRRNHRYNACMARLLVLVVAVLMLSMADFAQVRAAPDRFRISEEASDKLIVHRVSPNYPGSI